jgi:hypothetical protein
MDELGKRFAATHSGLDIHYDLGEGHPLPGRRMPDVDLVTADGALPVFTLLHDPGRCSSTSVTLAASTQFMRRSGPAGRRSIRRQVGASGTWGGPCSHCRADPARRYVAWVGDPARPGARRRARHLVRAADGTHAKGHL